LKQEAERRRAFERETVVMELQGEARQRELALARDVQQAALPRKPPPGPGLEIAVRFRPAEEVGGDFYERGGEVGLLGGDVAARAREASSGVALQGGVQPAEGTPLLVTTRPSGGRAHP
jgi:hypothetical protein